MAETSAWTGPISEPLQWVIPTADPVVDPEHVRAVAEKFESAERQIDLLEGFFHESYNEMEKEKAFACLKTWIQKHN
jgi:alpha-beta hydrolase superfamily lysophospholipase